MKGTEMKANRVNTLLLEIMMAVLFFALSAAVILELFASGHGLSVDARIVGSASNSARNLSQQIIAAEDTAALLADEGFILSAGCWNKSCGDYELLVKIDTDSREAGSMHTAQIAAVRGDEVILTLPCARYESGEVEA